MRSPRGECGVRKEKESQTQNSKKRPMMENEKTQPEVRVSSGALCRDRQGKEHGGLERWGHVLLKLDLAIRKPLAAWREKFQESGGDRSDTTMD